MSAALSRSAGITPGRWCARNWNCYAATTVVVDDPSAVGGLRVVAECAGYGNGLSVDREADARLIAAAPDLLEALRGLFELADLLAANCADRVDATNDPRLAAARAAITRATGSAE